MAPKHAWFWVSLIVGLVVDQATKRWVTAHLAYRTDELVVVPGFLSVVHAQNPGAAFGMLNDFEHRYLVFAAFTVIVVLVLLDLYRRLPGGERLMATSLGLILSGALGNAIDRVEKRTVTDFIHVYGGRPPALRAWLTDTFGTYVWPTFNVADAALFVGVVLFLVHAMFLDEEEEPEPARPGGDLPPPDPPRHPGDP